LTRFNSYRLSPGPIWSKRSFQSVSWFFHNYPGRFWAGSWSLTNTQPLSLIYKYNICILWVFLEPYFSSDYLGISYHSSICKNVKLFSVELWPVIFEIKNEKNSSSFFFSVKILSKDSILDSHRSHDYITFLVVREIFTILRAQHSLECTSFHTFSEKNQWKWNWEPLNFVGIETDIRIGNDILMIWCGPRTKWTDVFLFEMLDGSFYL